VCRVLGYVSPTRHGKADVCVRKRRGVVDAITNECHSVAAALQSFHGFDLASGQHFRFVSRNADLMCDMFSHISMVPGQHDDFFDPQGLEIPHQGRCFQADFIGVSDQSDKALIDGHADGRDRFSSEFGDIALCRLR